MLSSPYFIKKRPVSQKHCGAMLFLQNFQEKIPAVKLIFGQKDINSVKTKLYYGPKKSIWTPCCHTHIWTESVNSVKLHYIMGQNSQ